MRLRPRHPGTLLLALIVAVLLWYAATGKRRATISVRNFKANLSLVNMPSDLQLISGAPDDVTLQLRGPMTVNPTTGGSRLEVFLNLSEAVPGLHVYPIDFSGIRLPPELEVIAVEPTEVAIELERVLLRSLPIESNIVGEPAAGYAVTTVQLEPSRMTVQGPESRLAPLAVVKTAPVSIQDADQTVESVVAPLISDPLIRVLTGTPITVRVVVAPVPDQEPDPDEAAVPPGVAGVL